MQEQPASIFFYGLFMDESLLASRGVPPSTTAIGHVEDFAIRIGSRATLVPERGRRAYGVLMSMRARDVEALYADESVADYVAESVSVVLADRSRVSAICYNLPVSKLKGTNVEYARSLASLAEKLDLPDDYVEQIRSQAT